MGSPPPAGSKKEVLILRSVNSMVIAPANTGKDNNNKIAVSKTDQTNKLKFSILEFLFFILSLVLIKLIAPRIEDTPAKWREKIAKLTLCEGWKTALERGGYTVHPVPAPTEEKEEINNKASAGGNNQKLILFIRGKAISGAEVIIGTNQFPNPPIIIGITIKKIMIKAWEVTMTLYSWSICAKAL